MLKRICVLPPLQTLSIAVPAFLLVSYVLITDMDGPLTYLAYIASAYGLIVTVTGAFRMVRPIRQRVKSHPLAGRLLDDVGFRTELSLHVGLAVDLLYIMIKLVSGIYYRSLWSVSLAVYYVFLAMMRFLLLYRRKRPDGVARKRSELRRYRFCGVVLLLMDLALAGIVAFMVHQGRGYGYPGMLIYAMAAYSFYAVIMATVSVIRSRRHGSPILSAAKAIDLAAAMVSILSLETAMLARFGDDDDMLFRKAMTGATGGGICVIVLGMALLMIARSSRQLKQIDTQTI